MRTIVIVNHSTRTDLTPAWLTRVADALSSQLQRDVCPTWDFPPVAVQVDGPEMRAHLAKYGVAPWELGLFDDADQPGALGYHDVSPNSVPYGKAFTRIDGADVDLDALTVTMSHEVIEIVGNPTADLEVKMGGGDVAFCRELCDAVEDVTYRVGSVVVSDFVTPAWFGEGDAAPFDHCAALCAPFTRTAGGYLIFDKGGAIGTLPPQRSEQKAHATTRLSKIRRAAWRRAAEAPPATLPTADDPPELTELMAAYRAHVFAWAEEEDLSPYVERAYRLMKPAVDAIRARRGAA